MHTHKDRVAVVSGAASGIGLELAIQLAERGASLALLDIADLSETIQQVEEHRQSTSAHAARRYNAGEP